MSLSAFADKSKKPNAVELEKTLGRSYAHWEAIVGRMTTDHAPVEQLWSYSGAAWGWALRLKRKKRTIIYLTPCTKHFIAGFALGEKAVRASRDAGLQKSTRILIDTGKKYAEGRAVRIEVRSKRDRDEVIKLATIKMDN